MPPKKNKRFQHIKTTTKLTNKKKATSSHSEHTNIGNQQETDNLSRTTLKQQKQDTDVPQPSASTSNVKKKLSANKNTTAKTTDEDSKVQTPAVPQPSISTRHMTRQQSKKLLSTSCATTTQSTTEACVPKQSTMSTKPPKNVEVTKNVHTTTKRKHIPSQDELCIIPPATKKVVEKQPLSTSPKNVNKGKSLRPPVQNIASSLDTHTSTTETKNTERKRKVAMYNRSYIDSQKKKQKEAVHYNEKRELLSINMEHAPTTEQLAGTERDPTTALMALVTNTGLGRFSETTKLIDNWSIVASADPSNPPPEYVSSLAEEITSNLNEPHIGQVVEDFLSSWNIEATLFACASCGVKQYAMGDDQPHDVPIDQLDSLLMSDSDKDHLLSISSEFRPICSYYISSCNGLYYNLHREFVKLIPTAEKEDVEHATLCHTCYEAVVHNKKLPIYSLAAGIDYGNSDRIFLPKLTLAEEYVIANARLFILIIKLAGYQHAQRQSGRLGHAIVFSQYGPKLEEELRKAKMLQHTGTYPQLENFYETLNIAFIGSNLQWAALVSDRNHRMFKPIQVRSEVIYMWLHALKQFNSRYRDIVIDQSEDMTATLHRIPNDLLENVIIVDHESEINIDRIVHGQSANLDMPLNSEMETITDADPTTYPMSFLTRATPIDDSEIPATQSALRDIATALSDPQENHETEETEHDLNIGKDHQTTSNNIVEIEQRSEPLNEFEENDNLLYSAFPHLFPLGKGLRKSGSVPLKDSYHITNQWHGKFAKCLRLLFLLFDQLQRHSTARAACATVVSNEASMKTFSELIADPTFIVKLEHAKNHPQDPESKKLLAKLTPHISLVNRKVPYSPAERTAAVSHLMNMVRYYGPPSIFNTISQDDIHGLLNIRMTLNMTDNCTFPATENGLGQALRNQETIFQDIPIHPAALRILLAEGSSFAANLYYKASKAVFTHLFGTPPDGVGKKKTIPLPNRKKGIFGTPIAAYGCTEEQARGSLHMHSLFWGGLTPAILQAAGGIPGLQQRINGAIDRMIMAHIQPHIHVNHLLRDLRNEIPAHASLFKPHHPIREKQQFMEDFQRTVDLSNIHTHAPTCFKTTVGAKCCRMGRPVRLREKTGCEQIVAYKEDPKKPTVSFQILDAIQPPTEAATTRRNFSRIPVAVRDSRMVMYFLKRPAIPPIKSSSTPDNEEELPTLNLPQEVQDKFDALTVEEQKKVNEALIRRNGQLIEYNPTEAAVEGCNTNTSLLGSDGQAKAALCYVLKYMTKPPAELAHSLSLLYHARRMIKLYPSKAADTGTVIRTGIHFLNKVVNQMCGAVEISAQMAAAAIQGMPAEMSSDSFWVAYVSAAVTYAQRHPLTAKSRTTDADSEFADIDQQNSEIDSAEEVDAMVQEDAILDESVDQEETIPHLDHEEDVIILDDFFNQKEPEILGPQELNRQSTPESVVSTATIYATEKQIVAVPQHIHYAYRGPELNILSLYEYVALIDVVKKRQTSTTEKVEGEPDAGGRATNATFLFAAAHPLYESHMQRIRSKTKIPILVGPPPQAPIPKPQEMTDAWQIQARKFANYFLVLYRPWMIDTNDGGTIPGSTYWHDLSNYMQEIECGKNGKVPSYLDRIRCKWITNAAHGLRISGEDRTAATKYRCEYATKWGQKDGTQSVRTTQEPEEGATLLSNETRIQEMIASTQAQENINIMRDAAAADDLLERREHSHLEYYEATRSVLQRIFQSTATNLAEAQSITTESARSLLRSDQDNNNIDNILTDLRNEVIHVTEKDGVTSDDMDTIIPGQWKPNRRLPEGSKLSDQLNDTQKVVWNQVSDYLKQVKQFKDNVQSKPNPIHLLVHGGPGTGKSFLAECIHETANDFNLTIACIAPTGIAASNLPNGRTIHNFCSMPMFRDTRVYLPKLNVLKLASVQERAQHQTLALIIVDEISFVGPEMLAQLDHRMKQIMANEEPFGGVGIIITGDFVQLPPIAPAESLFAALLKLHQTPSVTTLNANETSTSPTVQGARLFATFKKIELRQQMRAANDPEHMDFLNKLRSSSSDPQTRSMETVNRIKVLSQADVQRDPDWMKAPIVVTSNEERFRINEQQSITLSQQNNCPRIIWYQPIIGLVANGLDLNQSNYLYATSPRFRGTFVAGAPGFLMANINPKRGLTNGTPVTFHSLILDHREDQDRVTEAMTQGTGDDIILKYSPTHVLVKITHANAEDFIGLTAVETEAVIPLTESHMGKPFLIQVPGKENKVKLQTTTHGIDLGFAVTMHKIQGQTCSKLIVDLNHRPFMPQITFPSFYVAVSRVRRGEDLRRLPTQPNKDNLKFLTTLQPPKQLTTWMSGYDANGYFDYNKIPKSLLKNDPKKKQKGKKH